MKIAVGMAVGDTMQTATGFSLAVLFLKIGRSGHGVTLLQGGSSNGAQSRNYIVQQFLTLPECKDADHLLLIDSDMEFPGDSLDRLLAAEENVVGAAYRKRGPIRISQTDFEFPEIIFVPEDRTVTNVGDSIDQGRLIPASHIGSGLLLIRRPVLEFMDYPWFEDMYGSSTANMMDHGVTFCHKARDLGYKVMTDFKLSREVYHIGTARIGLESIRSPIR